MTKITRQKQVFRKPATQAVLVAVIMLSGTMFASNAFANCAAQPVTWYGNNGEICQGMTQTMSDGARDSLQPEMLVTNTNPGYDGEAAYQCIGNVLTQETILHTPSCLASTPTSCAASTMTWTKDGYSCSATTAIGADGGEEEITDATGPATGSNTYVCQGGAFVQKMGAVVTCSASAPPPPPPTCSPPSPPVTDYCLHTVTSQTDEGCSIPNCSTTLYRISPVTDLADFSYWQSTGGTVCSGTCNSRAITGRSPSDIGNLQPCSPPPPC
ncbi:MAG: hypothetical protein V4621_05005 [Pseudomonadota bacterium]